MAKSSRRPPSVLNWLGTLILYSIPGINLIFLILTAIFAKSSAKRGFAIAGILLIILAVILTCVAFAVFPDYFNNLADIMRRNVAASVTPAG